MKLVTLFSLLFFVSCTITKRHFGPGYHVEWKKSHSTDGKEAEKTDLGDLKKETPKETETNFPVINSSFDSTHLKLSQNELVMEEYQTSDPSCTSDSKPENDEVLPLLSEQKPVLDEPQKNLDQPKRKVDPFTWAALGSLFIGLLLLATIGFAEMTLPILIILASLMVILSIISLIRIIRHPELYKARKLTWAIFWISMAAVSAGLVVLIFYLLVMTNNVDLF